MGTIPRQPDTRSVVPERGGKEAASYRQGTMNLANKKSKPHEPYRKQITPAKQAIALIEQLFGRQQLLRKCAPGFQAALEYLFLIVRPFLKHTKKPSKLRERF